MSNSTLRVVFFDVHDTLIYCRLSPPEIFTQICDEAGITVPLELVKRAYPSLDELKARRARHQGDEDAFWLRFNSGLLRELGIDNPDGALARTLVEGFKDVRWWRAFPDAVPTLSTLQRAGYRLGVIANARDLVEGRLQHTRLTDYFETMTYSHEAGCEKPDPGIFELALARMGCHPQEAVHVGDRLVEDVEGARGAGLRPILLDREDHHPDADCERVRGLLELHTLLRDDPQSP